MARPPTDFGTVVDAEIAARMARGEPAETIAAAIGQKNKTRTIRRRIAKLKGNAPKPTSTQAKTIDPATIPDEIPDNTPLEEIDVWLASLKQGRLAAEADKNWTALSSLSNKFSALMGLRQKYVPIPKPDPNLNPDLIKAAAEAEERLLTLAKGIFAPHGRVTST
jgi:hypothetical protein